MISIIMIIIHQLPPVIVLIVISSLVAPNNVSKLLLVITDITVILYSVFGNNPFTIRLVVLVVNIILLEGRDGMNDSW